MYCSPLPIMGTYHALFSVEGVWGLIQMGLGVLMILAGVANFIFTLSMFKPRVWLNFENPTTYLEAIDFCKKNKVRFYPDEKKPPPMGCPDRAFRIGFIDEDDLIRVKLSV
jgi:hypothetical protein